jgi:hypothetical protein
MALVIFIIRNDGAQMGQQQLPANDLWANQKMKKE